MYPGSVHHEGETVVKKKYRGQLSSKIKGKQPRTVWFLCSFSRQSFIIITDLLLSIVEICGAILKRIFFDWGKC
jgi:hypothetical protein